ncbi:MAG TPA: YsnF/AvaK domain-containing protein [Pyrinomonadaceae bacterium]|jgi:uncharacterized protein (TIGR02271 family)|nr:YsnF/AvaK domain-containing protein [Pyrinomonadaceae bacterium]
MAKTVIGMFRNNTEARVAVRELINSGIPREDIGITSNSYGAEGTAEVDATSRSRSAHPGTGVGDSISNFFRSLFGDSNPDQATYYSDAVGRGGVVVTVDADSDETAGRASAIMDRYGVDAHTEASAGGRQGEANYAGDVQTLPVIEEELQVGKREVVRGGVRVSSHVVERPVEEVVRLREERVRVERRPVNRLVTDADLQAFREGTIEITERAEEAVVHKQARVVEEVVVGKEVGEHTETIRDTVRRTDVEVEDIRSDIQSDKRAKGRGNT